MRSLKYGSRGQLSAMQMAVRLCIAVWPAICAIDAGSVGANPVGLSSSTPGVAFTGVGTPNTTITSSALRSIVNAQGFDIAAHETTNVIQAANAAMFVRIGGLNPTTINGLLNSTGTLLLINPNGVLFGAGAQVNVNGLIASSLSLTDTDFMNGRYAFQGTSADGSVRNDGHIAGGPLGVYLLGPDAANFGQITGAGGRIVLAAGTTAYLSDRADGRGFLAEVTAPSGEALNLGSLTANGGQVSMIGRLVTQSGLVQANTVQRQNGVIKLVASEQATLTPGSRTIADGGEITVSGRIIEQQGLVQSIGTSTQSGRIELIATDQVNMRNASITDVRGGDTDVSDGGTIAAMATNPTNGAVTIESGAVLNLSGGAQGGHGGELWIGGVTTPSVVPLLDTTMPTFDAAVLRAIPRTRTVTAADLADGSTRSHLNFYAMDDLTVSVPSFNLTSRAIAPALDGSARAGTLRFFAGNNFNIAPSLIQNGNRIPTRSTNVINSWRFSGVAGNDIQFQTGVGQTSIWSTGNGGISLQAGRDIKFVPDGGGGATTIQTFAGDIRITAGRDLIAPSALINNKYSGIRLDRVVVNAADPSQGAGNLYLQIGGSFSGARVNGLETGPGFVLSNGTAGVRIGGNLGSLTQYATFTVGSMGITQGQIGSGLIAGSQTTVAVDVIAQGNMFIANVQDLNLSEGLRIPVTVPQIELASVNPSSTASFVSSFGDIHLRPRTITNAVEQMYSRLFPASFTALAPNGNISIEASLEFWSSPSGSLNFLAGQSIFGSPGAGLQLNCPVLTCNPVANPGSEAVSPITFTALGGDISDLTLNLVDSYRKIINITARNNIRNVSGVFAVPELGDSAGSPVPSVTITAQMGDIDFSGLTSSQVGFLFGGTGWAKVSAGGNLNLGRSQGLVFQLDPHLVTDASNVNVYNAGGLLDLAVGGNIAMTTSKIQSNNGAGLFIHGAEASLPLVGATGMATIARVGGNPVYAVNGQPVLDATGSPVVVGADDTIAGHSVLVVNGRAVLGVNGKPIVVDDAESNVITTGDLVHGTAVLDRPLVRLTDGTIIAVINGRTVYGTPSGAADVNGRPNVGSDGVTLVVDGRLVRAVEPVGGAVNVGTSSNTVNDRTGILTVRGGGIDVKATGNIDVNRSRIATLGGGDIRLASTTGDINAGNGPRDEITSFVIEQPGLNGTIFRSAFFVPGSGIFTFHPQDGDLPNILRFDPLSPFHKQVVMHQFLGHDVSKLLPLVPAADEAWKNQYDRSVRQLFAGFRLGDITLKASHDVIVPPAGIRGRHIAIDAGHNLELQGGEIRGISTVNVGSQVVGSLTGFIGAFAVNLGGVSGGTSTTLGLGNIMGNVGSVTTTSSVTAGTSTASLTSSKAVEDAKSLDPVSESKTVSDRGGKKGGGQSTQAGSLRVRDRVRIKVETKTE